MDTYNFAAVEHAAYQITRELDVALYTPRAVLEALLDRHPDLVAELSADEVLAAAKAGSDRACAEEDEWLAVRMAALKDKPPGTTVRDVFNEDGTRKDN